MKLISTLCFGFVFLVQLHAQCPEVMLGDLQSVQRADVATKEAKILNLGFDLFAEQQQQGGNIRHYYKCWQTTINRQPVYDQVILWDMANNSVVVGFLQERHYQALRKAITERGSGSMASNNNNHYIGTMFRYYFGQRAIRGLDYFTVSIADK